jgi:uncharacterized membrane protein
VLHQVLQWHHLLSAHVPPDSISNLELNTLADGLFHLAAWLVTVAAVFLLWRAWRRGDGLSWVTLIGGLLAGWGAFNLVEGLVDFTTSVPGPTSCSTTSGSWLGAPSCSSPG